MILQVVFPTLTKPLHLDAVECTPCHTTHLRLPPGTVLATPAFDLFHHLENPSLRPLKPQRPSRHDSRRRPVDIVFPFLGTRGRGRRGGEAAPTSRQAAPRLLPPTQQALIVITVVVVVIIRFVATLHDAAEVLLPSSPVDVVFVAEGAEPRAPPAREPRRRAGAVRLDDAVHQVVEALLLLAGRGRGEIHLVPAVLFILGVHNLGLLPFVLDLDLGVDDAQLVTRDRVRQPGDLEAAGAGGRRDAPLVAQPPSRVAATLAAAILPRPPPPGAAGAHDTPPDGDGPHDGARAAPPPRAAAIVILLPAAPALLPAQQRRVRQVAQPKQGRLGADVEAEARRRRRRLRVGAVAPRPAAGRDGAGPEDATDHAEYRDGPARPRQGAAARRIAVVFLVTIVSFVVRVSLSAAAPA